MAVTNVPTVTGDSLRGPTLQRRVQEYIKDYIVRNGLKPGDPLPPEGELASSLGVSRGSVREAVKALQTLGIIEVRHGNGLFVRGFNFDSVLDLLSYGLAFDHSKISEILQIRKWLEVAAVDEVCQRIGDRDIAEIEDILAQWEGKAAAGQPTSAEDRAFHQALFRVIGNQSLIALLDIFWVVYHSVRIRAITTDLQPSTTLGEHRDILRAVRARDTALAQRSIEQHFRNLEGRIKKAFSPQVGE